MNIANLLNVVSTISAALAAFFSFRMTKLAKRQIDEQLRPQLVVFYREKKRVFRIGNVGKETAMNIKLEIQKKPNILTKVDLGEASIAIPPNDEQTIFFRLNSTNGVVHHEANKPAAHAIFRRGTYRLRIIYTDITSENQYITVYQLGETLKHIYTKRKKRKEDIKKISRWLDRRA